VLALAKGAYSEVIEIPGASSSASSTWVFYRAEEAPRQADTADAAALEKIRTYVMSYERGVVED